MKQAILIAAVFAAATASVPSSAQDVELDTPEKRLSYTIGMDIGRSLAGQQMEMDIDVVIAALRASYAGEPTLMSDQEVAEE
ncbi:MAG: FKBP-type peptidyl-prolyl cis-trans isomerase, partial [Gammaproteobacteria bacterium]|nr:FKBP-type peptidyl-prolyl cis-trans isomerase [Gammaproteobacteria bacterium]